MNQHRDQDGSPARKSRYKFTAGLAAVALASGGLGLFVVLGGEEGASPTGFFGQPKAEGEHGGHGFGGKGDKEERRGGPPGPEGREYRDHGDPADHQGGDGEFDPEEVDELEEADELGPWPEDFVDITTVEPNVEEPEPGENASTGTFTVDCGVTTELRNSENIIVNPGTANAAQHMHDYFGNQTVTGFTDDININNQILLEGDTSCENGDQSMHYWPVLRDITQEGADADEPGGGLDGNVGAILDAEEVRIEFRGNAQSEVAQMAPFLQIFTGNARAFTSGEENSTVQFTCTGFEDRILDDKYPLCPEGSNVMRIFDFPSCWDGQNIESEDNRSHIFFPEADGSCQEGTVPVPQLRQTVVYDVPDGPNYAIDSFPEERHDPITDHSDFINVMPEEAMNEAVECINSGRDC